MPSTEQKPRRGARRRHADAAPARPFSLSDYSTGASTAFIPLLARAQARALFPELEFADPDAERIVKRLGLPADLFGTDPGWMRGIVCRAGWFDVCARRFLRAHPDGLGISLGAGFDTRLRRIGVRAQRWVDIDLPEVIAVKRRLVRATPRYRLLGCDIANHAWMGRVGWQPGTPLLLTAEGVLMYLAPDAVRRLFRGIADWFGRGGAPVAVLFDYAAQAAALHSWLHPALEYTSARFQWGLPAAEAIRRIDRRYRVVEDRDIARECGPAAAVAASLHELMTMGRFLHGLAHVELERA
ncbi:MAG: class I SAM-dependent methyltransferase [Rhodospirillales bacterium]|nr:MAG: class I SAM-dependent methyltransferase [Rhodospirillales bacterium]